MDTVDKKNERDYAEGNDGTVRSFLHTSRSFLAESSDAFGLVPDACPLVTDHLMVAVNGYAAKGQESAPLMEMPEEDVEGLMQGLFQGLLEDTEENRAALRVALGNERIAAENPVSRYCAVLAEAVALQVFHDEAKGASYEQTAVLLSRSLGEALGELKTRLIRDEILEEHDGVFCSVVLGACRVSDGADGHYTVDLYSAGGFRLYLVDEQGMSPLWMTESEVISPDSPIRMGGRRIELDHPKPFALLLISESVYDLSPSEYHTLRESGGMIWRYRMRLEDQFIRLVTDCVHDYEFGARATRFFTGRPRGRKSATGALSLHLGGSSFEVFRSRCRARLTVLEKLISLLPKGYDPSTVREAPPRMDIETEHLRRLLEKNPALGDRMRDALRLTVLDALENGFPVCTAPPPEGAPEYRRPDWDGVREAFAAYDGENDEDRELMQENRRMLRELLSEYWITLRPGFARVLASRNDPEGERTYGACLDMGRRLAAMQACRRNTLACLEESLSDSLEILRSVRNDWVCARAGMESVNAWTDQLNDRLPELLSYLQNRWATDTEAYRGLLSAYTAERERLFRRDTRQDGFFAETLNDLLEGRLSSEDAHRLGETLVELENAEAYAELWESVCRLSRGIDALLRRIRSRAAARRAARDISNRPGLCLAALRGAAYEDHAWGETVIGVMDAAARNDFRSAVRRWQENTELARRQAEAYGEYSALYQRYL